MTINKYFFALSLAICLLVSSCIKHETVKMLQALPTAVQIDSIAKASETRLQPNDVINVVVSGVNPETVMPFNVADPASAVSNNNAAAQNPIMIDLFSGYLIDRAGNVDLPVIGKVAVAGETTVQVKDKITQLLVPYLKQPVVNVRLLNFRITVMGDVNRPGVIRLGNERMTLLEAIGQAGDLTLYANRTNVLVIREKDGNRIYGRVNLQQGDFFQSPFYYLQQNDVIYVEPIREKTTTGTDFATRALSFSSAAVSLISLLILLFRK